MTETLLFVGIGSILVVGVATLAAAVLTLRSARRYVELAEERMECLREGQTRLLLLLYEERQRPEEESRYPEAQHSAGEEYEERHRTSRTRRDGQPGRRTRQISRSAPFEESVESALEHHELPAEGMSSRQPPRTGKAPVSASKPTPEPQKVSTENRGVSPTAVWHPHPDDDVTPRSAPAGRETRQNDASMKMFRTLYDRYLDNYEGYVKLAGRLYRSRDEDEVPAGSPAEREWEERLRRVYDGIERTVARLDILEESNPELATDDRISQRTSIARSHSELASRRHRGRVADKERAGTFPGI